MSAVLAMAAGALIASFGLAAMLAWHAGHPGLLQWRADRVPVHYNTALGLFLVGGGLVSLLLGAARAAVVTGVAVLALGTLTLSQYLFAVDLGLDQRIVLAPPMPDTSHPGRMAPNTALGLMLAGLALVLPAFLGRGRVLLSVLGSAGVIVFGLGLVALAGYAMRLESAYGWGALTRMAVQTAAALVLIGTALVLVAWHEGSRRDLPALAWLPVPAGLGVFTILVLAWQASFGTSGVAPESVRAGHELLVLGALLAFMLGLALNRVHVAQVRWKTAESDREALRTEIAERRETELRLRDSEARQRAMISALPDLLFRIDADGRFVDCRAGDSTLLALPPSEFIGKTIAELFPPSIRAAALEALNETLATGQLTLFEYRLSLPGGDHDFELRMARISDTEVLAISRDITQRRRMLERLERNEAHLRAVGRMARIGGWEFDPALSRLEWTEETYRIHELPPGEPVSLDRAIAFYHVDDRPVLLAALKEALDHGKSYDLELRLITAKGNLVWTRALCEPEVVDGQTVRLRGTFQDVTERVQTEQRLRASERLVQMAANLAHIGGWEVDLEQNQVWWSDEVCHIHEMPPGSSIHVDEGIAFYAPEWRDRIREVFTRAARDGIPYDEEMQILTASGKRRWVRTIGQPVRAPDGAIARVQGAFQDITDLREIDEALRRAAMVFEHTRDGVVVTDAEGRILSVNRAFTRITGYTEDEVRGHNPNVLASGHHDSAFYGKLWEQLRELGHWQGEIRNRRKNGETYTEWLTIDSVRDDAGNATHYVGVFTDISEIKESQERLEFLAHFDALTGLPNRVLLESEIAKALERARRRAHRVALLYIDLDRFKAINDSLGHPVGDELLRQVPDRLRPRLRREDTLGRTGGDEFMLVLEHVDEADEAARVARDVLELLKAPFTLPSGHEVFIGASIGISLFPDDGASSSELIRNADSAMYRAKELGRNTFHFYTEELTLAASHRLALETRLRRAIENREFVLQFQPQVSVADGRTIGVEALVRWNDPEKGLVGPDEFIPVAEESGLIAPLGLWILQEACRQLQVWRHRGVALAQVAVNVSSQQFLLQDVTARVSEALERSGLPPECLELEITESLLMQQGDSAPAILHSLKDLGVRLVIDDFGTGYSSLAYLRTFPLDRLKIDQSFVRDIETDHSAREIASTVIAMGHNLSLEVLAEGVENARQLEILTALKCDAYQGFFASAPLPAEDLPSWLEARSLPPGA